MIVGSIGGKVLLVLRTKASLTLTKPPLMSPLPSQLVCSREFARDEFLRFQSGTANSSSSPEPASHPLPLPILHGMFF